MRLKSDFESNHVQFLCTSTSPFAIQTKIHSSKRTRREVYVAVTRRTVERTVLFLCVAATVYLWNITFHFYNKTEPNVECCEQSLFIPLVSPGSRCDALAITFLRRRTPTISLSAIFQTLSQVFPFESWTSSSPARASTQRRNFRQCSCRDATSPARPPPPQPE